MNAEARDFWRRANEALPVAKAIIPLDPASAASRAYYAAFYAVSAIFALEGKTFRRHSAVESAVHRDLVRPGRWPRELGTAFSALSDLRMRGDYSLGQAIQVEQASEAVSQAEEILRAVSALRPDELPIPPEHGQA